MYTLHTSILHLQAFIVKKLFRQHKKKTKIKNV